MMLESKDMKMVRIVAIVNRVWEAGHQITADASFDDSPTVRCFKDLCNRAIRANKELNA